MTTRFLLFFVLLGTLPLQAQLSWADGYVVTNEGDTVRGKIQINTPAVNSGKVVFKSDNIDKIVHKPFQIKGWGMGEAHYESKGYQVGREKIGVFMRRYTKLGVEVKCYEFWNGEGQNGYSMVFLERQQEMTEVQFGKFKKQLSAYFSDSDAVKSGLESGLYKKNFEGLLQLLEVYNQEKEANWD